jgi:hypothetical protein
LPLPAANITAAAMFRTIEIYRPTLLIDEADTFLRDNEELRGVINSGREREGRTVRLVGEDYEPSAFSTFCPTTIAAIGSLPGTIEDRAITITMRRRLTSEPVDRFRSDRADHLHELARKAARCAADHEQGLCDADPDMPGALRDRACDNWRRLLAIADLARWDWPQVARIAAQSLSLQGSAQDDQSRGVPALLRRCILRSLRRVGWCEFSARLFFHRPRSWRHSIPRSRAATPYDRKSSVIIRSGTKPYFLRSLRISFSAACLFRLDCTSATASRQAEL